jgi:hypothetical protein
MSESKEWWHDQDQDQSWAKKVEEELRQREEESNEPVVYKEFDEALIGFGVQFDQKVAIYDYARCLDVLEKGGMTNSEAIDYMENTVLWEYVGRRTAVFLTQPKKGKARAKKTTLAGQMSFNFGGES